ncbi:cyclic-phosphate processing receiver domain-containing protein [Gillisia sp. Hel_I_29]|uniref:cyclic-phosphate processing receiver domain-containing protein n=1 Tax=Gillisia sp. Hel_I_29 TaxID=1249975 RepID=UPI000551119E|nr:cyclic-phosphate processing receiver domain-containing protein [Gillisia sp. Hel_I_29]
MKELLWLDDIRDPLELKLDWLAYSPIGKEVEVSWVKNKKDFVCWIQKNGLPDAICFDHDLGENEPTGYDCAKWLVEYCLDHKVLPPIWGCQSANPVGKVNINGLLRNFMIRFQKTYC